MDEKRAFGKKCLINVFRKYGFTSFLSGKRSKIQEFWKNKDVNA